MNPGGADDTGEAMSSPILECREVSKAFGSLQAVERVSFSVAEGEIYGIAGPNGAGKTTLFNLISGIPYHADSGAVRFEGKDIRGKAPHAICHAGLARTFQTEAAFDDLTVEENVRIGAVFGRRTDDVGATVEHALEYVDLVAQRKKSAESLPLYTKKRLMLASAIACHPRLLLLDEPAAGLNQAEYEELAELIRKLNAEGTTIVLIEHVLPLLLSVSSQVMVLNSGTVVTKAPPDEIVRDEAVIAAYLGERGRTLARAQSH